MKQLEQPLSVAQRLQRRGVGIAVEPAVGVLGEQRQLRLGDAGRGEQTKNAGGKFGIGETPQLSPLLCRQRRPARGNIETTVGGKPGQDHRFEVGSRYAAPGGDILHGQNR